MLTVTVWCTAPPGSCQAAIDGAVRIAQQNLMSAHLPILVTSEQLPKIDPPEPGLTVGAVGAVRHAAVAVIGEPAHQLPIETVTLLQRARGLQAGGRSVAVMLYVDVCISNSTHEDLARKMPGDVGLPRWQLTTYQTGLELIEKVAIDLVEMGVARWDGQKGGFGL